jgi:HlyD family secretion protein
VISKKNWTFGALSAAALVALLVWAFAPRPVQVELAVASAGRFEVAISEDGKTRVRDRYVVSAPLAGRLARIALREGDAVAEGITVATLTPVFSPMLDARTLREQSARVETADAMVTRAASRIERAKVALEQARSEQGRSEQLARDGFVAAAKLESDRLATQAALKDLESATQEQHVATHELEQARAALTAVRQPAAASGANAFKVRAPVAGRVLRVVQPSETMVALGAPLLEIGDIRQIEIVAELLTNDALQARPGTPVRIERWGGPAVLEGRVRLVEPSGFTKISALGVEEQRVNVLIDITSPPEQWQALGDGFRVGVRVIALAQDNVLRVPVSAVFPYPGTVAASGANATAAGAGNMGAFVLADKRARLRQVEVGARNGEEAWIKSGLTEGERVIIYPGNAVRDGARVVARAAVTK